VPIPTIYEFGEFRLDVAERRLTRAGQPLSVPPKVFDTLTVLVEHEGRLVRRADLMARLWPDTFVEDATLARNISDLRKVLGEADPGQKLIETVPRVGYRFTAAIRKVDAPEASTEAVDRTSSPPANHTARWVLIAAGIAVALAALTAIVGWRVLSRGTNVTSIAVLPLLSLDETRENAILGQELGDALITKLSLSPVIVRPTSSVLSYTSRDRDPLRAGRELRVDAILDGVIQRHEGSYRITLRLLRVRDGRSIWAGTLDAPAEGVFEIQDTASEQIEAALFPHASLSRDKILATPGNQTARLAYYNGRYWEEKRNEDGFRRSIEFYRQAADADPGFARAYSGLAEAYVLLSGYGFTSPRKDIPPAREAAMHALQLDGSLGEAHTVLGLIAEDYDLDWATAESEYKRAIQLNPRYSTSYHFYGEYLAYMGRFEEGRAELERAEDLDPTSLIIQTDYAETYVFERQYEKADKLLRQVLRLDPTFPRARYWMAITLLLEGKCSDAKVEMTRLKKSDLGPETALVRGMVGAVCRDPSAAQQAIDELYQGGSWSDIGAAIIYAMSGDSDHAFPALSRAIDEREVGVSTMKESAGFDRIRTDPRWQVLMARMHFPQ
jgi:DNA-binding winged helix-turn-helix (wHTH) protein/TolB-like protein